MREERGQLSGPVVVYEDFTLWGTAVGDVKVIKGGRFYMRGSIYGSLLIDRGGRAHIFGNVSGDLTVEKYSKVIISGIVGGDVVNNGGRIYVDNTAQLLGKVKTKAGETTFEPKGQVRPRDAKGEE